MSTVTVRFENNTIGRHHGDVEPLTANLPITSQGTPYVADLWKAVHCYAQKYLASRDVDVELYRAEGGMIRGDVTVGGFRVVARFEAEVTP